MILLQPEGVKSIKPIGKVTPFEQKLIEAAIPELETNIEKVRPIPYPLFLYQIKIEHGVLIDVSIRVSPSSLHPSCR